MAKAEDWGSRIANLVEDEETRFTTLEEEIRRGVGDGGGEELREALGALGENSGEKKSRTLLKLSLASGLLAANEKDASEQRTCIDTLFLPRVSRQEDRLGRLLLSELTYVDQYVEAEVRQHIFNECRNLMADDLWAPAIRDYLTGWKMRIGIEEFIDTSREIRGKNTAQNQPQILLVASVKGGVGKTIISSAAAKKLATQGRKVLLVDLDASGPSIQYNFNVPDVTRALSAIPGACEGEEAPASRGLGRWAYPTWLDLQADDKVSSNLLLSAREEYQDLSFVLLPDSPTYSASFEGVSSFFGKRTDLNEHLDALVKWANKKNFEFIVIDLPPGLYGANGTLLRHIDMNYSCNFMCVATPRAFDLVSALYEVSWIYSAGEFFQTPHLVVNMWPTEKSTSSEEGLREGFLERLDGWVDRFIDEAIDELENCNSRVTSGHQIYGWRMWSYLYARGRIESGPGEHSSRKFNLGALPEDQALRYVMNPPEKEEAFEINWRELEDTFWWKCLCTWLEEVLIS